MKLLLIWMVLAFLILSPDAFAYLDPASGNALFSVFIAVIGFGIYVLKTLYYKITSRDASISNSISKSSYNYKLNISAGDDELVLFSEGKNYWGVFCPIVNELIHSKIHFKYYTIDVEDPALLIDNEYIKSKLFSSSSAGFSKISNVTAPIMLTTTPNVGCKGYLFKKPVNVGCFVHMLHAMGNIESYREGSLDYYDAVIVAGKYDVEPIRSIEKARGLPKKEILPLGLPYLDEMHRKLAALERKKNIKKDKLVILIAPSWGGKNAFNFYGIDFVKELACMDCQIIIRLHPHSYLNEPEKVDMWERELKGIDNIEWDKDIVALRAMQASDIMISDISSVRYDYAFVFEKPVITLKIPREMMSGYEFQYLDKGWDDDLMYDIGSVISGDELNDIKKVVENTIECFSKEKLTILRSRWLENFGCSTACIVDVLKEKVYEMKLTCVEKDLYDKIKIIEEKIKELK